MTHVSRRRPARSPQASRHRAPRPLRPSPHNPPQAKQPPLSSFVIRTRSAPESTASSRREHIPLLARQPALGPARAGTRRHDLAVLDARRADRVGAVEAGVGCSETPWTVCHLLCHRCARFHGMFASFAPLASFKSASNYCFSTTQAGQGIGLLNRCTGSTRTVGSNPIPSAKCPEISITSSIGLA